MYPAKRQQVVLVLEAEQLLHILHVAVVGAGRLLGDNHVCQQKLVVHLRAREHQSESGRGEGEGRRGLMVDGQADSPVVHTRRRTSRCLSPCCWRPAGGSDASAPGEAPPVSVPPLLALHNIKQTAARTSGRLSTGGIDQWFSTGGIFFPHHEVVKQIYSTKKKNFSSLSNMSSQ